MKNVLSILAVGCVLAGSAGCESDVETDEGVMSATSDLTGNAVGAKKGIMWGVNAHPGWPGTVYARQSIDVQMKRAASMGLRHFRINMSAAAQDRFDFLNAAIAAARPYGIVVTPVLTPTETKTEDESYRAAYDMAFKFAQRFRGGVPVWELGNEEDHRVVADSFEDNSDPKKVRAFPNYAAVRGKLRGLLAGIRAGDETSKVAVGDAGGCNYGFTQALWEDGLRWDMTLFHPYDFWGEPRQSRFDRHALRRWRQHAREACAIR